jgi:hypothetical protein
LDQSFFIFVFIFSNQVGYSRLNYLIFLIYYLCLSLGDQLGDINTLFVVTAVWCFNFSSAVWHYLGIAVDSQNLCPMALA